MAPKAGKRILLERIGPLWRRLKFLQKVALRNIFRYKKRLVMMVIGIGGHYKFGGNIPFFGINVPDIAGAAIFGIILNLLLGIGEKKRKAAEPEKAA